jgi:hypothetical protein
MIVADPSSAAQYPADYGFVEDTLSEDGDPLDALVLVQEPTFPGYLIGSRGGGSRGLPATAARAGEQARLAVRAAGIPSGTRLVKRLGLSGYCR